MVLGNGRARVPPFILDHFRMTVKNVRTLTKENHKAGPSFDLFHLIVTLLVAAFAIGLFAAQFSYSQDENSQLSLMNLSQRATMLRSITNSIQRDQFCIPLSAEARQIDA